VCHLYLAEGCHLYIALTEVVGAPIKMSPLCQFRDDAVRRFVGGRWFG
jgi:hypothetical protein